MKCKYCLELDIKSAVFVIGRKMSEGFFNEDGDYNGHWHKGNKEIMHICCTEGHDYLYVKLEEK